MSDRGPTMPPPEPEQFRIGSQREDQYTPMGEVAMIGDFAQGLARGDAWRARGWRRNIAITGLALFAVFALLVVAALLGPALTSLV